MTTVQARAPGKLFLTGEYVVLMGAPAVVAAVDRFVDVRLTLDDAPGPLTVESLAGGTTWVAPVGRNDAPGGDAGAVLAAFRAAAARGAIRPHLAATAVVDSRAFLDGDRKLGLGRSSATVAAATAAFLSTGERPRRGDILACGLAANALFQEGRGSGADLAAAVHGGVVEVTRAGEGLGVVPRTLPTGLHLLAGWTGESAPTGLLLARFAAAAARGPRTLGALADVAKRAAAAVAAGDAQALAAAVDRSADLLERLGAEVDIPIVTPALARLVAAARDVGAVAKPSGAGAGDCGIALARSEAQAAAVRAAWQSVGIVPLPLAVAPEGVTGG